MKIDSVFESTKDYSSFDKGKVFLKIMHSYGLQIDKAGESEPIRKEFDLEYFQTIWKGRASSRSKLKS